MHRLVASVAGVGLILGRIRGSDTGSGTLAALVVAPVALAINAYLGWAALLAATLLLIGAGVWSVSRLFESTGDAGWIVVDESAGMFLALVGLGLWPGAVAAFVVFRAADIFKGAFPGVARAERLPGGWGVTADDLVAGLYGLAAGHIVQALI